jgi:hypothetical protein
MASHWSRFVGGITEKQARALDRMARAHSMGDGMDLLMCLTGCSRSKVGKMDRLSLRRAIDRAFTEYGRQAP